ncbi:hypothetical protein [Hydrogenophaga sp.]
MSPGGSATLQAVRASISTPVWPVHAAVARAAPASHGSMGVQLYF